MSGENDERGAMSEDRPAAWDPVWERIFRERSQWGKYPPEELIRFVARHFNGASDRRSVKVLEVGCGPGAGPSWYLAREGYSFSGIDGSATAIDLARRRFRDEGLQGEFVTGAADALPWSADTFDGVIDIACLQHNSEAAARAIVGEIYRVLKPGGRHFSLATRAGCWGDGAGTRVDATSFRDVTEGPFSNMGVVRFATQDSLQRLYSRFQELEFEYSIRSMDHTRREIANWIVTCRK
jgi:ubiquinone/menaquinone biosynthesis C-methylase UbiE